MSSAMDYATTKTLLNSWARTGMFQIYFKYKQVELIVLAVNGILTGSAPGSAGYDMVDREKVLVVNKAMLCEMGSYKTAGDFETKFLMKNLEQKTLCSSTVVGRQLLKQLELVAPFSSAMEKEFKKDPNYKSITSTLKTYLRSTGAGVNSICNMRSWLELMTITGILHGSTYSLSRVTSTHSVISVNSFESDTFTLRDAKLMQSLNAVSLGTHEEFYAFSDHLPSVNRMTLTRHCSRTTARLQHSRIFTRKISQKMLKNTTITAGFYPITGLTSRTALPHHLLLISLSTFAHHCL
jgi:hypothetical protein